MGQVRDILSTCYVCHPQPGDLKSSNQQQRTSKQLKMSANLGENARSGSYLRSKQKHKNNRHITGMVNDYYCHAVPLFRKLDTYIQHTRRRCCCVTHQVFFAYGTPTCYLNSHALVQCKKQRWQRERSSLQ